MRRWTEFSPGETHLSMRNLGVLLCLVMFILLIGTHDSWGEAKRGGNTRTRAEVEAFIEVEGKTPPDWWDSVQLNYPETLDLNWPMKAPPPWNNQKNVGQYIWDVIHPNPGRWEEGVRLVHHLLTLNKDDPEKVTRNMRTLGRMYHDLLEDWARAAFWWERSDGDLIGLADCYWKLGNKDMAVETLSKIYGDYTRHGSVIKLWTDIGEIDKALKIAEDKARYHVADSAYLAAGDACRQAGRYKQALSYYKKVLAVPITEDNNDFIKNNKKRAQNSIEAIKVFDTLDLTRIPDGVYKSSSMAYNGQLFVEIRVKDNRIESAKVTRHREKQFYSAINDTTRQIVEKQGVKGVDATTAATITSDAIINATAKALASGMK